MLLILHGGEASACKCLTHTVHLPNLVDDERTDAFHRLTSDLHQDVMLTRYEMHLVDPLQGGDLLGQFPLGTFIVRKE